MFWSEVRSEYEEPDGRPLTKIRMSNPLPPPPSPSPPFPPFIAILDFKSLITVLFRKPQSYFISSFAAKKSFTGNVYIPPNMFPKEIPPGNPSLLSGGGPSPAGPNFSSSFLMMVWRFWLFPYLETFAGFWLTSWKASIVTGS